MEIINGFGTTALGALAVGFMVTALAVWRNQAVLKNDVCHLKTQVDNIWKHLLARDAPPARD